MIREHDRTLPVIALDGNHRTGKGTQLDILSDSLRRYGYSPLVLRGDGTRPGAGCSDSDPYSTWWQEFAAFESLHENQYDAWRKAACLLIAEAAMRAAAMPPNGILLFDRSSVSRAQMTLKEGLPLETNAMYTHGIGEKYLSSIDQATVLPDITIALDADADVLLSRLSADDPKYSFRRTNIVNSNQFFRTAISAYDAYGSGLIYTFDASRDPSEIATEILCVTMDKINSEKKKG
ncbi:MAG: hypothetical protein KA604_01215 [Candidatus Saccharimonas sp.]|nr:hypothetical protein [Candidatus Saccharimonas sp.]